MALHIEDGSGIVFAEAYGNVVDALGYFADMGYCGTAAKCAALINNGVAAAATTLSLDGLDEGATVLSGDEFSVPGAVGTYKFTQYAAADSGGNITSIAFSPAAPTGGFDDDAQIVFHAVTEDMLRRGTRSYEEAYRLRLVGQKASGTQGLIWPRTDMEDEDGNLLASTEIPVAVQHCTYEWSRYVTTKGGGFEVQAPVKSVKAGSVEVEFAGSYIPETARTFADNLMRPYLRRVARLMRA